MLRPIRDPVPLPRDMVATIPMDLSALAPDELVWRMSRAIA
jgi:hypothetical protein